MNLKYSVCIPNYNYSRYVGRTIKSVLAQDYDDFEICVSDNASTDDSVETIRRFKDPKIKLRVNQWNVGFAGNLDRAAALATGDHMIMLSSDDLMAPGALSVYTKVLDELAADTRKRIVLMSANEWIDADDRGLGVQRVNPKMWQVTKPAPQLAEVAGGPVLVAETSDLLRRSLELLRNPLFFLATCYPRVLYERVEGYGGGRLFHPDKWFVWKLLTVADQVVYIDRPLFKYRWHSGNQVAQQAQSGALKHLVDQYVNTFEMMPETLTRAGLIREQVVAAFMEQDIALRNLERVADGNRTLARRGLHFGFAAYPAAAQRNWKIWALRTLLALGPLGTWLAAQAKRRMHRSWSDTEGAETPPSLRAK